ncbi:MAG: transcription-repair coupling factor [Bacteroidia bacterium]
MDLLSLIKFPRINQNPQANYCLKGSAGSGFTIFLSKQFKLSPNKFLVIAPDKEAAAYLYNDFQSLLSDDNILFFPHKYRKPYTEEKTINASIQERTNVISQLSKENNSAIVVTYPEAIAEKVTIVQHLKSKSLRINIGDKIDLDIIVDYLLESNFKQEEFVYEPGQFSIRGGIVDVYAFSSDYPYRMELHGDVIDSLRTFDPSSQLSISKFEHITLIPDLNQNISQETSTSLLNYFPVNESFIALFNTKAVIEKIEDTFQKALELFEKSDSTIEQVSPTILFVQGEDFESDINKYSTLEFGITAQGNKEAIELNQIPQPAFQKNFELLLNNLKENKAKGYQNYFVTDNFKQANRLTNIFNDLLVKEHRNSESIISHLAFNLHEGFIDHQNKIALYTDHQIFNRYHRYKLKEEKDKARVSLTIKELTMLNPGDYVTHIDHGIGRFGGLQKLNIGDKTQEAVRLVYKDHDILYVSIHNLHKISKYSGKEGNIPRLDKLGGNHWASLKQKTKRKVKEIAFDLIQLYAKRKTLKGHAYLPDNYLQHELEASFMYEDTPDQVKVTAEVKKDMEKETPMDRLICGDVGFGKTEIAIRAAFKAVCDGKQVAVLVPTTILAYQHYQTFKERMYGMPCNVDYINRFRTTKEQNKVLKDLNEGKIDIIIGTHKLIGKSVSFKNLGLLVIDEEQKFGVGVKEKIKTLRENIDTLTLTATPIPRTLQFSLMGARDLSIISTPPANRYPVQTELHQFDEEYIRDAITYELNRGGQVFFVHNKIANIEEVASILQRLVPSAKIGIGHGRLDGDKLEEVILRFIEHEFDILVSTTIIESGIDISNANTIIINDAQNFGLSDLHQMRGRVGRSNRKAFCYLLTPPQAALTSEAQKRLRALVEFSDLGSGFQIAMRDLDIRGAGNLLGAEQSGFINEMGFDTYMKILNEAVTELKSSDWYRNNIELPEEINSKAVFSRQFVTETSIDSDLELLLPDTYVESLTERLLLYRQLDEISEEKELLKFESDLIDRFGPIPKPSLELINVVRLRWEAMNIGFEKLILKNGKLLAYFIHDKKSEYFNSDIFTAALKFVQSYPTLCQLKENESKLWLVIENVLSINEARNIMHKIITLEKHESTI